MSLFSVKPLSVIIRRPGRKGIGNESLLAGKRYDMECETTGSRPPAVITWYKGRRRQLKHTTVRKKNKKCNGGCGLRGPQPRSSWFLSLYRGLYQGYVPYLLSLPAQKPLFPAFFRGSSPPFLFRHFPETLKGIPPDSRARLIPEAQTFPSIAIRFD